MLRDRRSPHRSTIALDILLGNHPGAIAFTLILCLPHLTARSRVKLTSPPLLVLYPIEPSTSALAPPTPPPEATLLIFPPPSPILTFPPPSFLPRMSPAVRSAGARFRAVARRAAAPRAARGLHGGTGLSQ